ncbi:MAG: Amuc_1100 family pilus-like protein [Kiritimatiellae bacterium]|nr:Amuc_1100 family pilus-like protein [Kiritimatiellia bacterium]
MKNTKVILAALGGIILVAVLGAGFFAWCEISAKTAAIEGDEDGNDGLETVQAKADKLSRKSVYPCDESLKQLKESRETVTAWRDEAFALASAGDRAVSETTDAAFKEFIVGDARRLTLLPEDSPEKIVEANFEFGPFKPYIAEGKMPERDELKTLQRKWDDVATIIETLASNGVSRVTAIEIKAPGAAGAAKGEGEEQPRARKGRSGKRQQAKSDAPVGVQPDSYTYLVTCQMRPAAFVKTLNALEKSQRFMTVDDFSFRHDKDVIAEAFGAEKKDDSQSAGGRRGRRGRRSHQVVAEAEDADKPKFKTITDPMADPPFEVKLTVTVYDFKSLEGEKKEGDKEEEEKK